MQTLFPQAVISPSELDHVHGASDDECDVDGVIQTVMKSVSLLDMFLKRFER